MKPSMKNFWSAEGTAALDQLVKGKPLLAFDFDGTLAPIVARPDDARVPTAVSQRLALLATRFPVAIITGRSIDDVRPRLGFQPRHIVGNHGAQIEQPSGAPTSDSLERLRAALQAHSAALKSAQVQVEDKGYSLALHYRLAHDRQLAVAVIEQLLQPLDTGLRRFGGKCVENIVAADAPDKGDAVVALLRASGTQALLFVGDDLNDEAVFVRKQSGWVTVRIGNDAPHSSARFFLRSQAELVHLLQTLLERGGTC